MNVFDSMQMLSAGLTAQRARINATTSNLANAQSTRTVDGPGPYKRRDPVFQSEALDPTSFDLQMQDAMQTVQVRDIVQDPNPPRLVFDPNHPDANADGYVAMPNINMVEEMVNMLTATRSYEAQVTAMRGLLEMSEKALSLGR